MAFVDQSKKARIAAALKKAMPNGWKYSLAVRHYSTIVLTIQSAPVDILANAREVIGNGAAITDHLEVNECWLSRQFSGELLQVMERIKAALNTDNYDKSDIQTDYFDVGHYVDIKIGRWNKPFVYKPAAAAAAVADPVKSEDPAPYLCGSRNDSDEGIIARALALLAAKHKPGLTLSGLADTAAYLRLELGGLEHEIFGVIFLNNRHQVIAFERMFRGTIDGASVHVREVLKRALQLNAAAVIFAHNHPSGFAEPSAADEQVTRRLREALSLIDIRTLDHVIVTSQGHVSMAERGLI